VLTGSKGVDDPHVPHRFRPLGEHGYRYPRGSRSDDCICGRVDTSYPRDVSTDKQAL